MTAYRIGGRDAELGVYEGATALDAVEAMARDAGYRSYAECCQTLGLTVEAGLAELTIVEEEAPCKS